MIEHKPDGGPAFPQPNHIVETEAQGRLEARNWMQDSGMSLRDWFAGMALQGLCARAFPSDKIWEKPFAEYAVEHSFELADAMLAERSKPHD